MYGEMLIKKKYVFIDKKRHYSIQAKIIEKACVVTRLSRVWIASYRDEISGIINALGGMALCATLKTSLYITVMMLIYLESTVGVV